MQYNWLYTALPEPTSQSLAIWVSNTLTVRSCIIDCEKFVLEMNNQTLPYIHSDGHQQPSHFYLLLGEDNVHAVFMHGPHTIMDGFRVLRGFNLILDWIAQPPQDENKVLAWGTEWQYLAAGPITATGGPRMDWDTIGIDLMEKTKKVWMNPIVGASLFTIQDMPD